MVSSMCKSKTQELPSQCDVLKSEHMPAKIAQFRPCSHSRVTIWLQTNSLTGMKPSIPSRWLRVIGQRHLIFVMVTADIRRCNTLITIASLLDLLSTTASDEIIVTLSLGLGVPEAALVALVVWVGSSRTAADTA